MRWIQAGLALLLGVSTGLAGHWEPSGVLGGTATASANCGGVTGTYGAYTAFALYSSTSTFQDSHGTIGGYWYGSQYEVATCTGPLLNDAHCHDWVKNGPDAPTESTLQVQMTTGVLTSGSCARLNTLDNEWWWRPTVSASVDSPKVQKYNSGSDTWTDEPWDASFGDSGSGSYTAHQTTGQESVPSSGTHVSLNRRNTFPMPTSNHGTVFRVRWPLHTSVTASVDNAVVTQWRQGLHVDCASQISSADSSEDFDLWE